MGKIVRFGYGYVYGYLEMGRDFDICYSLF